MDCERVIISGESTKQLLGLEDEGLISPEECGRKRHKLEQTRNVCCTATERIDAKI